MLKIGDIVQTVKGLVETKIDLIKRDIQEEVFGFFTKIILLVLMGGSLLLVLLFMSLSLAFYLSQYFEAPYMGFFLVGVLYLVVLLILYLIRENKKTQDKIQLTLKGFLLKAKMLKKEND